MEYKRETWVDIAKGIAIIAVVFGHLDFTDPEWPLLPVRSLFAELWHVAVFFLIGGFFLKEDKLQNPIQFIKGKFYSLYLLILYIYIPILCLHNLFIDIGFYDLDTDYSGRLVSYWGTGDFLRNIVMAVAFAGREPLLGAMWFVYVLFMALCILTLISRVSMLLSSVNYEEIRLAFIFVLAVISCSFTNIFDITIPRCSNVFTAVLLVYVGMKIKVWQRVNFDNGYVAALCAVIVWHITTTKGLVSIAANVMPNVMSLLISSCTALYVVCYLSKRLEHSWLGGGIFFYRKGVILYHGTAFYRF